MLVSKFSPKLATNRMEIVAHKVIHPSWTTFLPGKNIIEGGALSYPNFKNEIGYIKDSCAS
jgi:hypothetical protein